jgi:DNA-nicking Smr family endonuclease
MARRRGLTPDERRLWNQVAATAVPLRPADAPAAAEPAAAPVEPPRKTVPSVQPLRLLAPLVVDPVAGLERAHPHMDRRRFDKLRRGRMDPEERLDLHGMTAERAHAALTAFILSAAAREVRLVLVITGKGKADESSHQPRRHGILRHSLPHWLAAPPVIGHILQVAPAHQRHGGAGAYYVYLRRRR